MPAGSEEIIAANIDVTMRSIGKMGAATRSSIVVMDSLLHTM